ncbi:hypothetical protein AF335_12100 [Streptomyces eurocidicus]|uniref:Uncharacterized protein n=1 Tax=Streptomyces eurocidicus TaxID=66423 RepID=A0A2N8NXT3_STREU|nr:hypothetical protein [Streptomyces eurocidicus]MBB5123050.1 hypothetical protein [Streptomyces eurocidicus]MBF6053843.1 hypothetical protein [Streptomyces eurocidicus]PNE33582.1 hypothetical protein AF335_12100 [Streptomyces eurocidicus]
MTKHRLRALAVAVTSLAAVATSAPQTADAAAPAGTPVTFCLTDASAAALRAARIRLAAVAPATLVTERGHACVRAAVETGGRINPDLSGGGAAGGGGFAFRRGRRLAVFESLVARVTPDRTMVISAVHRGRWLDVLTSPTARLKLYLTKVSAEDIPMHLTPDGADALAAAFTTGPLPAGARVFTGSTGVDVLEQVTGLLGPGQRSGPRQRPGRPLRRPGELRVLPQLPERT